MMADWLRLLGTATLACVLGMPACFSVKEPTCAFTCLDPPHLCPASYTCGTDFLCHRAGTTGACALTPPGEGIPDAGTDDASD